MMRPRVHRRDLLTRDSPNPSLICSQRHLTIYLPMNLWNDNLKSSRARARSSPVIESREMIVIILIAAKRDPRPRIMCLPARKCHYPFFFCYLKIPQHSSQAIGSNLWSPFSEISRENSDRLPDLRREREDEKEREKERNAIRAIITDGKFPRRGRSVLTVWYDVSGWRRDAGRRVCGGSYRCDACDKSYCWRSSYQRHLREECGKEPRAACRNCGKQYRWRDSLNKHLKNECGALRPRHACTVCSMTFPSGQMLTVHLKEDHWEWHGGGGERERETRSVAIGVVNTLTYR